MNGLAPDPQEYEHFAAHDDTVSLLDLLNVLARRKLLIVATTILAAVLVLAFLVVSRILPATVSPLPDYYRAEALVILDDDSGSSAQQMLSQSNLGGLLSLGSVGGRSYGELALRLLESPSLLDDVASSLNVVERFEMTERPTASARQLLTTSADPVFEAGTGILTIAFESTDPVFAQEAANEFMTALERRFQAIGISQNAAEATTLAVRLREVEARIADLESDLTAFQREHNITSIQGITEERTRLIGGLRSDLILKDVEIQAYEDMAPANDPVLVRLRRERSSLARLIGDLDTGSPDLDPIMVSQQRLPELLIEFARLQRDLAVQTEIYAALSGQYELTRLSSASQRDVFQVLESAEVPEQKAGPSRSMIAIIVTITAFFLAVFLAFVLEYFSAAAHDPEESEKLRELRNNLSLKRRGS